MRRKLKRFFSRRSLLQEGPHSTLPEDEFFDAVESGLDKIEEDQKLRVRLRLQSQQVREIIYIFLNYHFINFNVILLSLSHT